MAYVCSAVYRIISNVFMKPYHGCVNFLESISRKLVGKVILTSLTFLLLYLCYVMFDPTFRAQYNNVPNDVQKRHSSKTVSQGVETTTLRSNTVHSKPQDPTNTRNRTMSRSQIDIEKTTPSLEELYDRIAIVTAFSQNHYLEALPFIASAQDVMPDKKIIIYNLGLNPKTIKKVKQLCNVELRPFPYGPYPKHVKNLHTFAWKPIIIHITLKEFGAIFWGDASIRFRASVKKLLPFSTKHHGFMSHWHSFDPKVKTAVPHQYFHTLPETYAALGVNRTEYYASHNLAAYPAANRQLYVNSSVIQEKLVQPMLRCALKERCIAPVGARVGKHRFDASVLAILVYKNLTGEWTPDDNDNDVFDGVIAIQRTPAWGKKPRVCNSN